MSEPLSPSPGTGPPRDENMPPAEHPPARINHNKPGDPPPPRAGGLGQAQRDRVVQRACVPSLRAPYIQEWQAPCHRLRPPLESPGGGGGAECAFCLAHFIRGLGIAAPDKEPQEPLVVNFFFPSLPSLDPPKKGVTPVKHGFQ